MRVLVAFDKFKDALTAPEACAAATTPLEKVRPEWTIDCCPLADGGEGFAAILTSSMRGAWHTCTVSGPQPGSSVESGFGLVATARIPAAARALLDVRNGTLAVVEMATASGLALLPPAQRNPWRTTSVGTGELLRSVALRADSLLLGVGGSATHDLGLGALRALGWRAFDAAGNDIEVVTPEHWPRVARLQPADTALPPLRIASDVENPLLGPRGAAHVYAPQKGAAPAEIPKLEAATARLAGLLEQALERGAELRDRPGTGAAGGITYGLMLAAKAQLLSGAALVGAWLDLDRRIEAADVIVTGEGRFDTSSLEGKGPGAVVRRALAAGKPVHVFAGRVALEEIPPGVTAVAITPPDEPLAEALRCAPANLAAAVERFARTI
jgi:glycerate 2-kinase